MNNVDEGVRRVKKGRSFIYVNSRTRKKVTSQRTLRRIESLVIPPAWQDVTVCTTSTGHIQAVGTDEAGRRQYIYHQAWHAVSAVAKFDRMYLFGKLLPKIRRQIRKDLNKRKLSKSRVLAAVVRLLDKAHLRVGNQRYVEDNGSHGATTLTKKHCDFDESYVWLDFPAKSKQQREIEFRDPKVAKVIAACSEIRGQYLFQYLNNDGQRDTITSTDVNEYLYDITGEEVTAKDFRTWWGTTIALESLENISDAETKKDLKKKVQDAVKTTARELANTKAVCRTNYIHPGLLKEAESGKLPRLMNSLPSKSKAELTLSETRALAILPRLDFT